MLQTSLFPSLFCFATQLHLHLFPVGCAAGPALQDTFPFQPFFKTLLAHPESLSSLDGD